MAKDRRTTDIVQVAKAPFGEPYVLALAIIAGPDRHGIHRIIGPETSVGASPSVDFTLSDPQVSGEHFRVRVNGHMFSLQDMKSTNGTLVNQNPVSKRTPVRLKNFDEIEAGNTRLLFIANRYRTD